MYQLDFLLLARQLPLFIIPIPFVTGCERLVMRFLASQLAACCCFHFMKYNASMPDCRHAAGLAVGAANIIVGI